MTTVSMTINVDGIPLSDLAAVFAAIGAGNASVTVEPATADVGAAPANTKSPSKTKSKTKTKSAPEPSAEEAPSVDDIKAAILGLVKARGEDEGASAARAILKQFGAAKLSELKPADLPAVLDALKSA